MYFYARLIMIMTLRVIVVYYEYIVCMADASTRAIKPYL